MGAPARRQLTRKRWALSALLFFGIVVVCGWPVRGWTRAISRFYCPLGNIGMAHLAFGTKGRARFVAAPEVPRREGDNVEADAILALSVDGVEGELPFGVSLRRDVFLPWLLLVAMLVASPASLSLRVASPLIGAIVVWCASVGAYALFAMWIFAGQVRGVYDFSPLAARLTDFVAGTLLFPPGNRFIAPLVLGGLMIVVDLRRSTRPPTEPLPPRTPSR